LVFIMKRPILKNKPLVEAIFELRWALKTQESGLFIKLHLRKQGNRLRLLPPYREHLAQAFARFFMRVGLPADIPKFK